MGKLIGAKQLHKRYDALAHAPDDLAHDWADDVAEELRARIPVKTGATRDSVRVEKVDREGAQVVASPVVFILDAGAKAHTEVPVKATVLRWGTGAPTFRPRVKHPGVRGRRFRQVAADRAFERQHPETLLTRAWNEAA